MAVRLTGPTLVDSSTASGSAVGLDAVPGDIVPVDTGASEGPDGGAGNGGNGEGGVAEGGDVVDRRIPVGNRGQRDWLTVMWGVWFCRSGIASPFLGWLSFGWSTFGWLGARTRGIQRTYSATAPQKPGDGAQVNGCGTPPHCPVYRRRRSHRSSGGSTRSVGRCGADVRGLRRVRPS